MAKYSGMNIMIRRQGKEVMIGVATLLLAYALMLIPLDEAWVWWRPHVFWMVLMVWVVRRPQWMPLEWVFFLGLGLDSLVGSYLGQQAFACVLTSYVWRRFVSEGWASLYTHRVLIWLILLVVYQIVIYLPLLLLPNPPGVLSFWQSFVSSLGGVLLLAVWVPRI